MDTESAGVSGVKILLVDDSDDNRFLIKAFLKNSHADIVEATNGEEGLLCFTAQHFDLVLMDIMMPVMDGLTCIQKIRQWEKRNSKNYTPILVISALVLEDEIKQSLNAGADKHLQKPIKKQELLDAIRESQRKPPKQMREGVA